MQSGLRSTSSLPKARALRKMPPTLSGSDTPSSTTTRLLSPAAASHSPRDGGGALRSPAATQPWWKRTPQSSIISARDTW